MEAGQRHFHVIYLCLRDEGTPGQLCRTLVIADLFDRVVAAERREQVGMYAGIYASLFEALIEFLDDGRIRPTPGDIANNIVGATADERHESYQPFWKRFGELFELGRLENSESNIERAIQSLELLTAIMSSKGCIRPILVVKEKRFRERRHSIQSFLVETSFS
jgi:hypothetical protein